MKKYQEPKYSLSPEEITKEVEDWVYCLEKECEVMEDHLNKSKEWIKDKIKDLKDINKNLGGNSEISKEISELEKRIEETPL